jgi:hypothetical protein
MGKKGKTERIRKKERIVENMHSVVTQMQLFRSFFLSFFLSFFRSFFLQTCKYVLKPSP